MTNTLQPSRFVRRFSKQLVESAHDFPVVDIACGSGRNALFIAGLGGNVICVDRDLAMLRRHLSGKTSKNLELLEMDLVKDSWRFRPRSIGAVVLLPANLDGQGLFI